MGTHVYLNTRKYPHSGYPRGYVAGTSIIFIQRGGDEYHIIRTNGYSLTSLIYSTIQPFLITHKLVVFVSHLKWLIALRFNF